MIRYSVNITLLVKPRSAGPLHNTSFAAQFNQQLKPRNARSTYSLTLDLLECKLLPTLTIIRNQRKDNNTYYPT